MVPRADLAGPAIISILLVLLPTGSGVATHATLTVADISPHLWSQLEAGGEADFLVVLREQADLTGTQLLESKQSRAKLYRKYDKRVREA